MGMTMTQKILAAHAGLETVEAGQLINASLDEVLGNDITTPVAINEFKKAGFDKVFDNTRINIVLDHFVPNKDIKAAEQSKQCRDFANAHGIVNFFDVGEMGIEHALLPEKGIQGRQWLVKEDAAGFDDNGPGESHPLLLPAGKLVRIPLGQVLQVYPAQGFHHVLF